MHFRIAILLFLILLSACASNVPMEIREDTSAEHLSLSTVRADIERYTGHPVRWGGAIASVQNKATDTWLEVVERDLGAYGRPQFTDRSEGRFFVRVEGFLDSATYRVDRLITVSGILEESVAGNIGEYPYTFPVVRATSHYLWTDYEAYDRYYGYPYWYYRYPYYYSPYWFNFGYYYGYPPYFFRPYYRYPW